MATQDEIQKAIKKHGGNINNQTLAKELPGVSRATFDAHRFINSGAPLPTATDNKGLNPGAVAEILRIKGQAPLPTGSPSLNVPIANPQTPEEIRQANEAIALGGQFAGRPDLTPEQRRTPIPVPSEENFNIAGFQDSPPTSSPVPQGTRILNEADLQTKREELTRAGVRPEDFAKFISAPDGQGNLFFTQPATLTNTNTGEKKVVATGSQEASRLLSSGNYKLGSINVTPSTVITGTDLVDEANIEIAGLSDGEYPTESIESTIASSSALGQSVSSYLSLLKGNVTETTKEANSLTDSINELLGETAGQAEALANEEERLGIRDLEEKLTNKVNEINIRTAALQQNLTEEELRPQTLGRLQGRQAMMRKQAQADIMFLQSEAQALMNNISFAKDTAQKAVEAKYNPILEELNIKLQQLELIQPELDKEEAQYASAVKFALQDQQNAVVEKKNVESQIQGVKIDAINAGITDADILSQIGKAETVNEALQIFGTNIPQEIVTTSGGGGGGLSGGSTVTGTDGIVAGESGQLLDPEVSGYIDLVNQGRVTAAQALDDISKEKKGELAIALSSSTDPESTLKDSISEEKSRLATDLTKHKGLNSSVGTTVFGRFALTDRLTGAKQDFIAGVEQLVSGLSLDALIQAKAQGATFGALSDSELQILSASASKIGTWRQTDKNGNVTGYKASEKSMKEELDRISKTFSKGENVNRQVMDDGTVWELQPDGNYLLVN